MRALMEPTLVAHPPSTSGPSETRSVIRPSRPTTRSTRTISLARVRFRSSTPLNDLAISFMRPVRAPRGMRAAKSPCSAARRASSSVRSSFSETAGGEAGLVARDFFGDGVAELSESLTLTGELRSGMGETRRRATNVDGSCPTPWSSEGQTATNISIAPDARGDATRMLGTTPSPVGAQAHRRQPHVSVHVFPLPAFRSLSFAFRSHVGRLSSSEVLASLRLACTGAFATLDAEPQ